MNVIKGSAHGFTLIEVMVAMAIFGTAALAAVNAASSHLTSISQIQQKTFAQYVASNRLVELTLASQWPIEDNASGRMQMAEQDWQWQQQVVETVTPDVVAVTVSVSKPNQDGEIIALTRYVRRPDSGAAGRDNNGVSL
ncbi:MAG: type II secretion system protein GspI [Idiomarina sp.]|uniref:type II secretion system minor pseudopilin GspI n=1 Tax=Idiomarina sp. TaxID=1874361 RepID=UPI000C357E10|nr:type II secretion system minor pseudopilin GspI [Idiomarina sp.]MAK71026.1 type II secretion system protein GspI [Idiomarinaceae bacterium]MBT40969.1 type II secretion system protein GspI [Idiomarina sp.]